MYDISLFRLHKNKNPEQGIFREIEIANFTEDFCVALGNLCNDIVALKILEFFDEFEKCGAREDIGENPFAEKLCAGADLLHKTVYDKCIRLTLHRRMKESGLKEVMDKLSVHNALDVVNTPEMLQQLEELLNNASDFIEVIEPRKKEHWNEFYDICSDLSYISKTNAMAYARTIKAYTFNSTPDLMNFIKANKELFYSPNDKPKDTGMGSILRRSGDLKKIVTGLKCNRSLSTELTVADKRYI